MSCSTLTQFEQICLICMCKDETLVSINADEKFMEPNIISMLAACTAYKKLSPLFGLPKLICQKCLQDLHKAYELRRTSEQTLQILLELLAKSKHNAFSKAVLLTEKGCQTDKDDAVSGSTSACKQCTAQSLSTAVVNMDNSKNNLQCQLCPRQFTRFEHLKRHLAIIHDIVINDLKNLQEEQTIDLKNDELDHNYVKVEEMTKLQHFSNLKTENTILQNSIDDAATDAVLPAIDDYNDTSTDEWPNEHQLKQSAANATIPNKKNKAHKRKIHQCMQCEKIFSSKLNLQRHMTSHDKKRYGCKECLQTFNSKEDLSAHIKNEGHNKPMLCPECGLRCKTSNILVVHMRRHKGEKPFSCKFCNKGFPRMDDLRVHEKYHTGEKSHFCETCGKGFQRKYNLTIHRRIHSGERPHKCPHCTQAFAQGNDLKAHIRRHTGERFCCEFCDATFLQGYQIRNHKFTEHGIKEEPPTKRVAKYISPEEQEKQIMQILQKK